MSTPDTPFAAWSDVTFVKGHGTQNDFVLLSDDDSRLEMHSEAVATLADRRAGLGADGIIRIVRSAASGIPGAAEQADAGAEWFMDYYNSDGSLSEMCGNGVRVFAHGLVASGRVPAEGRDILVGTRDGIKTVRTTLNPALGVQTGDDVVDTGTPGPGSASDSWYTIDMGEWSLDPSSSVLVTTGGIEVARPGLRVSTGNPHTVVALAENSELAAADLRDAPVLDPVPAQGSNVEYIVMEPARADVAGGEGALRMRVFERGVGETRSCGTGACAAAIAAHHWAGEKSPLQWRVDVPGGQLRIEIEPDAEGTSGRVSLAGPAVLVASGTIS
ncbi:MAG: diaminopimelate epimerase [Brevibacterium sp.]|uniref:diaminopimelate epimerase n=1 Tax=Brevibacterium sp. TaxID=1701 RepID=UPI003F9100C8